MAARRDYWIYQYTRDRPLIAAAGPSETLKIGDSLSLGMKDPKEGDVVLFFRAGAPAIRAGAPDGWGGPRHEWRGLTGAGVVSQSTGTECTLQVVAYDADAPTPDFRIYHDWRVAGLDMLFGQSGDQFGLDPQIVAGIVSILAARPDLSDQAKALINEIRAEPGDALSGTIESLGAYTTRGAGMALQWARAFSGVSTRRGDLTWPHLLLGARELTRDLRRDAKTGAVAKAIWDASSDSERLDKTANWLCGSDGSVLYAELDRRQVDPIEKLSPSAQAVLADAKAIANDRNLPLISVEILVAAILRAPGHRNDPLYEMLFGLPRDKLIDDLLKAVAERGHREDHGLLAFWLHDGAPEPGEARRSSTGTPSVDPARRPPNGNSFSIIRNDTAHGRESVFPDVTAEARAFARQIATDGFTPPMAIGVFGHWGTGKTFFIQQIDGELKALKGATSGKIKQHIARIHFNAWHYMETNIWASLVDVIFKELDQHLRSAEGQNATAVETLFGSLSSAQNERLAAIETLAERTRAREDARNRLAGTRQAASDYWKKAAKLLKKPDALNTVAVALGYKDPKSPDGVDTERDGARLQASITELRGLSSDAARSWRALRAVGLSPVMLLCLAGLVCLGPLILASVLPEDIRSSITATTSGIVAAIAGWGGLVAQRARSVVTAMQGLETAFTELEKERESKDEATLARHDAQVSEAEQALEFAEAEAAKAQRNLTAGTALGRITAFIRARAEGDTYSRHLGIVDTVRRDFEQLSTLMQAQEAAGAQDGGKAWKEHVEAISEQIDAVRQKYQRSTKAGDGDAVLEALESLKKSLEPENNPSVRIDRIVLFIDDLDRCPPAVVYKVLQAVHLFLAFPLFVAVVGVDTRWMEASLNKELGDLVDGSRGASAQDYLEKIFQIPYWTRRMTPGSSTDFVSAVAGEMVEAPSAPPGGGDGPDRAPATPSAEPASPPPTGGNVPPGGAPDDGDEAMDWDDESQNIAPSSHVGAEASDYEPISLSEDERRLLADLAPLAGRSPRQLLRFVNVFNLVKTVAGSRRIDLDGNAAYTHALAIQLAIATGAPNAAQVYFRLLADRTRGGTSDVADLKTALAGEFRAVNGTAYQQKQQRIPDDEIRSIDIALTRVGAASEPPITMQDLIDSAPVARRYTFAAVDAVFSDEEAADADT